MLIRLSESDLRFLVETVVTRRTDHAQIVRLVRDKEDLLEQMLEDPKLLDRIVNEEETLVRASPYLLFSILLREVRRELEKTGVVYEPESRGRRVPVFQAPAVVDVLSDHRLREYLIELLCSFVRTNTGAVYWKERGTWHERKFSDTDIDDMVTLAGIVDRELKPRYLKRVADIALFNSGVFPDQVIGAGERPRTTPSCQRTLSDYEEQGQRFYALAARESSEVSLRAVLENLSAKFSLVRTALNTLSDRFLKHYRSRYFDHP